MKSLPTLFYESPAERGGRSSSFGLPADLLDRARSRVRIVAFFTLFGSGFDVVISVGRAIATHSGIVTAETPSPIPFLGTCATFTLSVAMVLLSRVGRIRSVQILRAALVFEILLCATLSITNPIAFYDDTGALPILTWVTPLLILFALIVPFPPRITLLTAILAAATRPFRSAALGLVGTRGRERGGVLHVLLRADLGHRHGVFRIAGRARTRAAGRGGAPDGELPPGAAPGKRRGWGSVVGAPPVPRSPGGREADPTGNPGTWRSAGVLSGRPFRTGSAGDGLDAVTARSVSTTTGSPTPTSSTT
ncbi:MAG: hypothetical protein R3E12_07010 [Candidatus Eisenbacteria bacterium]